MHLPSHLVVVAIAAAPQRLPGTTHGSLGFRLKSHGEALRVEDRTVKRATGEGGACMSRDPCL